MNKYDKAVHSIFNGFDLETAVERNPSILSQCSDDIREYYFNKVMEEIKNGNKTKIWNNRRFR